MKTEIPAGDYDIVVFENKFPTFSKNPDRINNKRLNTGSDFPYRLRESKGICEVICYTPNHDLYLEDLPYQKIANLINVWRDRYLVLGGKKFGFFTNNGDSPKSHNNSLTRAPNCNTLFT